MLGRPAKHCKKKLREGSHVYAGIFLAHANFPCIAGNQVMVYRKAVCDHDSDRFATSCAKGTGDRHNMYCSSAKRGTHCRPWLSNESATRFMT